MTRKEIERDLAFLRDMGRRLDEGDVREVEQMVSDWIDELEKKLKEAA